MYAYFQCQILEEKKTRFKNGFKYLNFFKSCLASMSRRATRGGMGVRSPPSLGKGGGNAHLNKGRKKSLTGVYTPYSF